MGQRDGGVVSSVKRPIGVSETSHMVWDIILAVAAFCSLVIAVRGETWKLKRRTLLRRITGTGWAVIIVGLIALTATIVKSANDNREKAEQEKRIAAQVAEKNSACQRECRERKTLKGSSESDSWGVSIPTHVL
jgi:hypothetical protein